MSTFFQTAEQANTSKKWHLVDAQGKTLGRLATEVAVLLRGKNKVTFTKHVDGGDFVVVINASQVHLTGKKLKDKIYKQHTGYVGGLKEIAAGKLRAENPEKMIQKAVWGMLPSGPLGRQMIRNMKVYGGAEHPHAAQRPEPYTLKYHRN